MELDIDNPFKLQNNKLKLNYGNGFRLSKDLESKLELYIDAHVEYWGTTEGQKYLGLSKNIANFTGLIGNSGLTLKLDDGQNKLNIDIDVLKAKLYNILGDNLIYDSTTKKLDVKNYETVSILKGKMLIEDHSITYLNLQDISGMKYSTYSIINNIKKYHIKEIVNYRNKTFEYKNNDKILDYIADNKNPNESNLLTLHNYFKSNIIEDYRITFFIVIKNGFHNIFNLYNNDESLQLLHAKFNLVNNKLKLIFNTTDIHALKTIETDLIINKKGLICISWNGINSAVYTNGKKIDIFTHSGVGSTTSGNHIIHTPDNGQIYEFIIFNSLLLNDDKINSINRYLADKHDITL